MSESDANHYMQCTADACRQGRMACPVPDACRQPEASARSWLWSDLGVIGIGVLTGIGFIAGWLS